MTNFESVEKFMKTFGQEIKKKASFPSDNTTSLRYDLIKEELEELKQAIDNKDIKEVDVSFDRYSLCYVRSRPCIWYQFRQMFCRSAKLKYE